jgi:hypothetical protein
VLECIDELMRVKLIAAGVLAAASGLVLTAFAQIRPIIPGKSIGKVSTRGDLIVFTLDEDALGKANLFDLGKHTLRFTPGAGGYRVEQTAFSWDRDVGSQAAPRTPTMLHNFSFPFSGRTWDALNVDVTGSIGFGGGVTIGRFDQLQTAATALVGKAPAICVFLKPRMTGPHFVKELADRVVITWTLTEPFGGIQDFTWTPTVNRFQAVLSRDGTIQMSYDDVAAKDAIVGVYQALGADSDRPKVVAADLSSLNKRDGPFTVVYESFHYLSLPNPRDLTCTVLDTLGDNFDFLAYYSDFRVDNQEAGTPSNGPLGGGPNGGAVTGIGAEQKNLAAYCTRGRFQWQYIQPVYVGANQMQEYPPADYSDGNSHDIGFYLHQLGERTPDGRIPAYDYALSQIGHEMGHRWSAFVSARVKGETIPLGPTHWARGLQAPAPFAFQRPTEASAMGGGVWQDNLDGTFTQLDDDYYVPATAYSYLDLYLMGLIGASEVPDFFILRNLTPAGRDANGHAIVNADRTKVSIQDVIAVHGPRLPDVDHAQKRFNTGMVVMVEHGKTPSRELIERATGIRGAWIDYFATVTGHRASMTATVK